MSNIKNNHYKILSKEEKQQELTLEVEVDFAFIDNFRSKVIKNIGKEIEIKGFRKGTAPDKLIIDQVGETKIFEESAFEAINQILPVVMLEEKINALTQPQITITKLVPKNPLVLKIVFILMPKIELADYKKIAPSIPRLETILEEKEIENYINYIRRNRAEAEKLKNKTSPEEKNTEDKKKETDVVLPEFNDDFVKTLGNFKNVEDFKAQLKENMLTDKKRHDKEKRRVEIVEKIIGESKIDLPNILIEDELDRMLGQFKTNIRQYKMEPDDYLKEIKKTESDLRNEWRADATKRAKMNLILPQIANVEKIEANPKQVEDETKHLVEHHKVDEVQAKQYVQFVLRNEAVLNFLEELK